MVFLTELPSFLFSLRRLSKLDNIHVNVLGIIGGEHFTHYTVEDQATFVFRASQSTPDKCQNGHKYAGYVYSAEYELSQYNGSPFDRNLHDSDAPCAVLFVNYVVQC